MYRLTIYYLGGLILVATVLSFFKVLAYDPLDILIITAEVVGGCLLANQILSDIFHANSNIESTIITALILSLLITPKFPISFVPIAVAGAFAIGSKYLATILDHHVVNPVAAGLIALALLTDTNATWWVGTPALLPFVIIGGYLIIKKVNRQKMVLQFLLTFWAIVGIAALVRTGSPMSVLNAWWMSFSHTALIFFAVVMFTEPATSPGTDKKRGYFALLTAALYATPQLNILGLVATPEIALALANVFSFVINPQYRFVLKLKSKKLIAKDTYEFIFEKLPDLKYLSGQYMEWTLPHDPMDNRGNRRYFSLSSTAQEEPAFAIKYYEPPSSYKKHLLQIPVGATLSANNLAGDFTLTSQDSPLVFIAGGIGIAPFRAMIKEIVDLQKPVQIDLIYINKTADEVAYFDLLQQAKKFGVNTHFVLTDKANLPTPWHGFVGHLTAEMIKQVVANYSQATYYISGPQGLVEASEQILKELQIPHKQIETDFFPGY